MKKLLLSILFLNFIKFTFAQEVKITFLQLNDVYEISAVNGGKYGGLSRVQTVLDSLKKKNKNTFFVLAGDMLSPSAIGTAIFNNEKLAGKQMVDLLNKMPLDFFVLGNHEFDLSENEFRNRLSEMKFKTISDNVLDTTSKAFPNTIPAHIITVQGVKIGLLGVTLNSFKTKYALISDPLEAAKKAVTELKKNGADILIALTHQNIQDDADLAVAIPEINLIMGGHDHENFKLFRGENLTPITKADANAKTAFIHHFEINTSKKKCIITSELLTIDKSIKPTKRIEDEVNYWTQIAFDSFEKKGYKPKEQVCVSDKILDGTEESVRNRKNELTSLITNAYLNAYPTADAALMNAGTIRIDDKMMPGPITQFDILKISPFGGTISLVKMNGKILLMALNQGIKNKGKGSFLHYANIELINNSWMIKNSPIEEKKEYLIALGSFLVEKGDQNLDFLTFASSNVQKTEQKNLEFFQVVIDQFKKQFTQK